ncbi:MAG: hypothetical protein JEY94_12305 [Melioribacteraceae bacterium]|nr:hypothetical protein [Melioribacteraceae bacterium]
MQKLSVKSIVVTIIFSLLVLTLLDMFIWNRTKSFLYEQIQVDLNNQVNLARKIIDINDLLKNDNVKLKTFSDEIKRLTQLRTTIISKDGVVLSDSEIDIIDLPKVENHIMRPEVQAALSSGSGFAIRKSETIDKDLMYYCENLHLNKRVIGFIRFAMFSTNFDEKMDFLNSLLAFSNLFMLVIVILFLYYYNKHIQSHIKKINNELEQAKKKNRYTAISPQRYNELDSIAGLINSIGLNLQNQIDDLSDNNSELSRVFNSLSEGVAAFSESGHLLFCNQSFKMFFEFEENPEHNSFYDIIHFPPIINDIDEFLKKDKKISRRIKFFKNKYIDYNISGMQYNINESRGFILTLNDVTKLARLEIVRQDFVANVSHEFKTPLTSIRGYSETLLSGKVNDETIKNKFLQKIENQAIHLENMVTDLLQLSRIEKKEFIDISAIDPYPIIDELVSDFKVQCESKGVKLTKDHNCENVKIETNERLLQTLVSNLLTNALKYNKDNGEIKIYCENYNGNFILSVSDQGIGIPEKEQNRIFERFYRVEEAMELYPEGSGLGLSIVKNIVDLLNGEITLESKKGEGSKFSIIFPLV